MPRATLFGSRFYWNVVNPVGIGCFNYIADVELVQFAYFCMATNRLPVDTTLMSMAAKIKPGEPYDGTASDKLSQCIVQHQRVRGGGVDGRVSPISSESGSYLLVALNTHLAIALGTSWPELGIHPACSPELALDSSIALVLRNSPRVYDL